jgi:hypothetical protein
MLMLAAVAAASRTTWSPPDELPLRERRGGGQIFRAAGRLYRHKLGLFVGTGVIFIPVSFAAAGVQWVLFNLSPVEDIVALDGRGGAVTGSLAFLTGGIGAALASVITTAAVAFALQRIDSGQAVSAVDAFRAAFDRLRALAVATAKQLGSAILLSIILVGIPFAIRRFVRWSLFAEACVLEDRTADSSLQRSAELVDGRWWRTLGFTTLVSVLTALSGPLLGVALLLLTDQSLDFVNIAGALVYAVTVPYAAIALTLYYFDLEARQSVAIAATPMPEPT